MDQYHPSRVEGGADDRVYEEPGRTDVVQYYPASWSGGFRLPNYRER